MIDGSIDFDRIDKMIRKSERGILRRRLIKALSGYGMHLDYKQMILKQVFGRVKGKKEGKS
jgi:hypothetical protein